MTQVLMKCLYRVHVCVLLVDFCRFVNITSDFMYIESGLSVKRNHKSHFSNSQKMQRKLREQGRKVKRAEEELAILKQTKKEVDDVEALWTGMSDYIGQIREHRLICLYFTAVLSIPQWYYHRRGSTFCEGSTSTFLTYHIGLACGEKRCFIYFGDHHSSLYTKTAKNVVTFVGI